MRLLTFKSCTFSDPRYQNIHVSDINGNISISIWILLHDLILSEKVLNYLTFKFKFFHRTRRFWSTTIETRSFFLCHLAYLVKRRMPWKSCRKEISFTKATDNLLHIFGLQSLHTNFSIHTWKIRGRNIKFYSFLVIWLHFKLSEFILAFRTP